MFRSQIIDSPQAYLVADYDTFSLTVGILRFHKREPRLEACTRSFFPPEQRKFHPTTFGNLFHKCCLELQKTVKDLPKEVCVFVDHHESVIVSSGYTFHRKESIESLRYDELAHFANQLYIQADTTSKRLWNFEYGYQAKDRKLISLFLAHLALDKKHYLHPLGKYASEVTMRCLYFYGNRSLVEGIDRSIRLLGYSLLSCVPLSSVFLNHLCTKNTFLDNHLHIHCGHDSTTVILHLGRHVQEIVTLPFGWKELDTSLAPYYSPLEREDLITGDHWHELQSNPEYPKYEKFIVDNLLIMFERFGLQWSFSSYTISGNGIPGIIVQAVKQGHLTPWIQKQAVHHVIQTGTEHWLQYWNTLDPLFTIHPHPLLSLIRSVFTLPHENN